MFNDEDVFSFVDALSLIDLPSESNIPALNHKLSRIKDISWIP